MIKQRHIYSFIFLLILSYSCVEPFHPEIEAYENILVVDGFITDEYRPYLVKLSRSFSYGEYKHYPVRGALVVIMDENGESFELKEEGPGSYYSDTTLFTGMVGLQYRLHVVLDNGKAYESEWVFLKKAPPIERLDMQFERKETPDPQVFNEGFQVYLNSHDLQDETWYYRWEWEETWEFTVPMKMPSANKYRCWGSDVSRSIMIGSSRNLISDRVIDYPLHFVSTGSNRLRKVYSLVVKQHAISQSAYEFWKMQEDLGENAGTLFDPIPTAIPGNIYCIDDPEEPVLGYFEASGVSTKRIFINREMLPSDVFIPNGFEYCKFESLVNPNPAILNSMMSNGWIYVDEYNYLDSLVVRLTNHASCLDCTLTGTNVKPDYWPLDE
jgi:hypothetical protein